ncbi:MAG: hypothetical protein CK551_10675 [Planctomycetaceae bacterium]|nr:hypothetical protein [Gemmataceae bacterium]PHX62540.1 MAG: hypothetical protein CK551_10675 [Planctomycetaceae bacterium]
MKNSNLLFSVCVIFILLGATQKIHGKDETANLLAGTAKVDITPPEKDAVNLAGQPLRKRDSLYARVVVLKDKKVSLAIVSVDLIVFSSLKVITEARKKWGVDHVILCSTHTHAAMAPRGLLIKPPFSPDWTRNGKDPGTTIDWPALSSDPWYAETEDKIIAAIGKAMNNLFAAKLVSGKGPFESAYMAHNRRLVREGGPVLAMWENPDRRPTKPIDPTVGVIRIDDLKGKPRALMVQYACHPVATMSAGMVSRDFPGAMVDHIEQELGDNCMGMFLQGAQGDLDPYDLHNLKGENRFNIVRMAGISLAKGALKIASTFKETPKTATPIQIKESLLTLAHRNGTNTSNVGILTVVINKDLALVAIPGEPFISHQIELTSKSPIKNTLILGLAYHGKGSPFVVYIPTVQAVKEGGYGATECSFLAADAGEKMISEAVLSIQSLLKQTAPSK